MSRVPQELIEASEKVKLRAKSVISEPHWYFIMRKRTLEERPFLIHRIFRVDLKAVGKIRYNPSKDEPIKYEVYENSYLESMQQIIEHLQNTTYKSVISI